MTKYRKQIKRRFRPRLARQTGKFYKKKSTKLGKGGRALGVPAVSRSLQRGYLPFGLSYWVKLPYGVDYTLATSGNSPLASSYGFRTNSLYDPDASGAGHQPFQYDQLTQFYQKYIVYGFSYDLTCTQPTTTGLYVGVTVRHQDNTTAAPLNKTLTYLRELRLVDMRPISTTGKQYTRFKGYVSIAQFFQLPKKAYVNQQEEYGAAYNSNPAKNVYFEIVILDPAANAAAQTVTFAGRFTYYAKMYDYLAPSQS